jgi:orotidine-5'-phosphate decarboxylase
LVNHLADMLTAQTQRLASPVVVGLDPRWEQLPYSLCGGGDDSWKVKAAAYTAFCNGIMDVVAPLVPAVKVQAAFFKEIGAPE